MHARIYACGMCGMTIALKLTINIVLKSSGSSFENFIRDEFTTLPEAADRILSTAVNMEYEFPMWTLGANAGEGGEQGDVLADVKKLGNTGVVVGAGNKGIKGDIVGLIGEMGTTLDVSGAVKKARKETLRVFCEESASVQVCSLFVSVYHSLLFVIRLSSPMSF